jgi:hypothetical protein
MKNYVDLLEQNDCTKLLSQNFKKGMEVHIVDPVLECQEGVKKLKFSLIADDALRFGEAYFGNFHYEVLLRFPNSIHGESIVVKKPYAMFMMDKIRSRNAAGDNTFNADDYVYDYNKYLEQDFDKQIQEVEKEYYDNIIYFKDKQFSQEKGE